MKTVEVQLAEALDRIKTIEAENKTLKESATVANVAAAKTTLASLIAEAKLPAPAVELLNKQFAGAEKIEGMKEAVENLGKCIVESRKITKNNGANDQGADAGDGKRSAQEVRESSINALVKSGISKAQAELMVD